MLSRMASASRLARQGVALASVAARVSGACGAADASWLARTLAGSACVLGGAGRVMAASAAQQQPAHLLARLSAGLGSRAGGARSAMGSGSGGSGGRRAMSTTTSPGAGGAPPRRGPQGGRRTSAANSNTLAWLGVVLVGTFGLSYAAVPLYRMFCQVTGYGGTTKQAEAVDYSKLTPVDDRKLRIQFAAETAAGMPWKFVPTQREIRIVPGQTVLACFTATNNTDEPMIGIATYNVTPQKTGKYFHKVQCFCFEEQRLNPREEVDMPVFFYVDPSIVDDPRMDDVNLITLSYTFFKSRDPFDEDDDDDDDE
ncbi:cytochrome c oxidase assembly protein COX11 [Thecamonas trahens ATCC 50062]|uniref:Cytochrome c oxidase assembly protein COX11 n=1 Tax=Thecamonas trahens ATCC 50062 TaxID=461836 RepID=A0A0L0DTN7_THETB|nr:cytochrome c oxidase assembly protein COX11 [Thecamonas trahens ATCC 50062]KNC55610.1 cytochrome c oxidase assembly protein COX11 [Thecamonas trahens ATCC 50062]|eukprot:XP_013761383.1 cytochrome c oxidase assembly protein COX11 [Thecamonas trahens ATCC 50062]